MAQSRTTLHILAASALVALLSVNLVFAQEAGSASFSTDRSARTIFGGSSSSTSFTSVEAGGQSVTGEATSTSYTLHSGILYFDSFTPRSQNWRWYEDETNATPSAPLANENAAPIDITSDEPIKLRVSVAETADIGTQGAKFRLQFATTSNFSQGAVFVVEAGDCVSNSGWCYADGVDTDNAVIENAVLTDSNTCVSSVGDGCGIHNESGTSVSSLTHKKSAVVEYEFTIKASGAVANTVYFFRLFNTVSSTTALINTGETYPSLTTEGAALTFTISGISESTATEGVVTDIDTTPTDIAFGLLSYNITNEAAQQLVVSTNAQQGYKIYVFERQSFENGTGDSIEPVAATNPSPASWNSACINGAGSCWGYHTGEDVLDGGSARFAPDDTYARFDQTPYEIAYNAGPATEKTTDMVYRIYADVNQDGGNYTSSIVYIVTPVF